jgi:hypothetical protein
VEFTEVIKRRKKVRAFTAEPLAPGTADRLLKAAAIVTGSLVCAGSGRVGRGCRSLK